MEKKKSVLSEMSWVFHDSCHEQWLRLWKISTNVHCVKS